MESEEEFEAMLTYNLTGVFVQSQYIYGFCAGLLDAGARKKAQELYNSALRGNVPLQRKFIIHSEMLGIIADDLPSVAELQNKYPDIQIGLGMLALSYASIQSIILLRAIVITDQDRSQFSNKYTEIYDRFGKDMEPFKSNQDAYKGMLKIFSKQFLSLAEDMDMVEGTVMATQNASASKSPIQKESASIQVISVSKMIIAFMRDNKEPPDNLFFAISQVCSNKPGSEFEDARYEFNRIKDNCSLGMTLGEAIDNAVASSNNMAFKVVMPQVSSAWKAKQNLADAFQKAIDNYK